MLLGLPLEEAVAELERRNLPYTTDEVSSRKGCDGKDKRVISVREDKGEYCLVYACFMTDIQK